MSDDSQKVDSQYIDPVTYAEKLANAGFQGDDLVTMLAITMGESSLDIYARNPVADYAGQTEKSKGLTQINYFAHPEVSDEQAYDPDFAASYAYMLYLGRGGGFQDWGAYTAGTYHQYLEQATAAVSQLYQDVTPAVAQDTAPAIALEIALDQQSEYNIKDNSLLIALAIIALAVWASR